MNYSLLDTSQTPIDTFPSSQLHTWRVLGILFSYRVLLSSLFIFLHSSQLSFFAVGNHLPTLFNAVSIGYFVLNLVGGVTAYLYRPNALPHAYFQMIVDIIAIVLLMHASGGVDSGLGMLMVVAIIGGGILIASRMALLFAALAAIAVLAEQAYSHLKYPYLATDYTQAAALGAAFLATAFLVHVLVARVRHSEHLVHRHEEDLANLGELNEYIIQHMNSGILVIDAQNRILLLNRASRTMLGLPETFPSEKPLSQLCNELFAALEAWRHDPSEEKYRLSTRASTQELLTHFTCLGAPSSEVIIFLEDSAAITQQAQQLKLASLGRLTASIAHEIRNPLAAISHAAQLLDESPDNTPQDLRFIEIIRNQSRRMDTLIENVLQLSRRAKAHTQNLELKSWIKEFCEEGERLNMMAKDIFLLQFPDKPIPIRFDTGHLHQIVANLCQNAVQHNSKDNAAAQITLKGGVVGTNHTPYLDIIDQGPGIPAEIAEHIFEPFVTSHSKGTGLGLYIARELCECNKAHLNYNSNPTGGSRFRIRFSKPKQGTSD